MAPTRNILLAALLALLAASCRTVTPPPGFVSVGEGTAGRIEFPADVSLECQYSLLSWYCDQYGDEARRQVGGAFGVVVNAKNDRARLIRGIASQSLVARYPGFAYVPPPGGIDFLYDSLSARGDFEEMDAMLDVCQDTLELQRTVAIPVGECVDFLSKTSGVQEVTTFRQWASLHQSLELDGGDGGMSAHLSKCREALALKHRMLDSISAARRELESPHPHSLKVMEALDGVSDAGDSEALFSAIGDFTTVKDFASFRAEAPGLCVETVLSRRSSESLDSFEGLLSESLSDWECDARLRKSSDERELDLREAGRDALARRVESLRAASKDAAGRGDYVNWMESALGRAEELSGDAAKAGAWGCYVRLGLAGELSEEIRALVEGMKPDAIAFYLLVQRDALEFYNRPAVVLALDRILQDLQDGKCAESSERAALARKKLSSAEPLFTLKVEELRNIEPAMGASWTADLVFSLRGLVDAWNATSLLTLAQDGDGAEASCVLKEGTLVEYKCGPVESQYEVLVHRWYGDARMEESGSMMLVQQEWLQRIGVKTSSRVSHVRVRGILERNGREKALSVNEFYSKSFTQETETSVEKGREYRCQDERDLKPVGAPKPLRNERSWSEAEMMDLARRESLRELAAKVFVGLFELYLEDLPADKLGIAERKGRLLFALESLTPPEKTQYHDELDSIKDRLAREIRQETLLGTTLLFSVK